MRIAHDDVFLLNFRLFVLDISNQQRADCLTGGNKSCSGFLSKPVSVRLGVTVDRPSSPGLIHSRFSSTMQPP
jgi:hypothetical protein